MAVSNGAIEAGNLRNAAPYFIAGRTAVAGVTAAAGEPIARLCHFGMLVKGAGANGADGLVATPIRISQVRLKIAQLAPPTTGATAFEIVKGTSTAQASGAGTLHLPQRRKTTYPEIGATETSLYVSNTDDITGGDFAALDASGPLDMVSLPVGESVWSPGDALPLSLEAGEALEVRCVAFEAASIVLVAFDFFR